MRQIKDVLRLKLELHHSHQHSAASLGVSKGVVAKYVELAGTAGLYWPQIQAMDETALHSRLMGAPQRASSLVAPDYTKLHQELRRKGIHRLWAYAAGAFEDTRAVVYDLCESRAGENAKVFLGDWRGSVVCVRIVDIHHP